jgi:hypothetical protein
MKSQDPMNTQLSAIILAATSNILRIILRAYAHAAQHSTHSRITMSASCTRANARRGFFEPHELGALPDELPDYQKPVA